MSNSDDQGVVRSPSYSVHFADEFAIAVSTNGIRLQVQQKEPDGYITSLCGLQIPFHDALGVAQAIEHAVAEWENFTGSKIPRPNVEFAEIEIPKT